MFSFIIGTTKGLDELNQLRDKCRATDLSVRDGIGSFYPNAELFQNILKQLDAALVVDKQQYEDNKPNSTARKWSQLKKLLIDGMKDESSDDEEHSSSESSTMDDYDFYQALAKETGTDPQQIIAVILDELAVISKPNHYIADLRLRTEILSALSLHALYERGTNNDAGYKFDVDLILLLNGTIELNELKTKRKSELAPVINKIMGVAVHTENDIEKLFAYLQAQDLISDKDFTICKQLFPGLKRSDEEITKSSNNDIIVMARHLEFIHQVLRNAFDNLVETKTSTLPAHIYLPTITTIQHIDNLINQKKSKYAKEMTTRLARLREIDLVDIDRDPDDKEFILSPIIYKHSQDVTNDKIKEVAKLIGKNIDNITAAGIRKYLLYIARYGNQNEKIYVKSLLTTKINFVKIEDKVIEETFKNLVATKVINDQDRKEITRLNILIGKMQASDYKYSFYAAIKLAMDLDPADSYSLQSKESLNKFYDLCDRLKVEESQNSVVLYHYIGADSELRKALQKYHFEILPHEKYSSIFIQILKTLNTNSAGVLTLCKVIKSCIDKERIDIASTLQKLCERYLLEANNIVTDYSTVINICKSFINYPELIDKILSFSKNYDEFISNCNQLAKNEAVLQRAILDQFTHEQFKDLLADQPDTIGSLHELKQAEQVNTDLKDIKPSSYTLSDSTQIAEMIGRKNGLSFDDVKAILSLAAQMIHCLDEYNAAIKHNETYHAAYLDKVLDIVCKIRQKAGKHDCTQMLTTILDNHLKSPTNTYSSMMRNICLYGNNKTKDALNNLSVSIAPVIKYLTAFQLSRVESRLQKCVDSLREPEKNLTAMRDAIRQLRYMRSSLKLKQSYCKFLKNIAIVSNALWKTKEKQQRITHYKFGLTQFKASINTIELRRKEMEKSYKRMITAHKKRS